MSSFFFASPLFLFPALLESVGDRPSAADIDDDVEEEDEDDDDEEYLLRCMVHSPSTMMCILPLLVVITESRSLGISNGAHMRTGG